VPSQRTKKKKLRASDLEAFLKIAGFEGQFVAPGTAPAIPTTAANSKATTASGIPTVNKTKAKDTNLRPRPDASFKIRDSFREISQQELSTKVETTEEQQEKIAARDSIDEEKVVAALQKYIAERKPEPTIELALKAHRPVVEGERITIFIDNQLQIEKIATIKIPFHNMLTKLLNNGSATIEFKLFDDNTTKEEKKLFTASEKFDHFVKLNPAVADLKNIFGLELD